MMIQSDEKNGLVAMPSKVFTLQRFVIMIDLVETAEKLRQKFRLSRGFSTNRNAVFFMFK